MNRQEKVKTLGDEATALFLQHGLENVAIEDITRASGVPKGSFYRYFVDKRALVEHLFEHPRAEIDSAFSRCEDALSRSASREDMFGAYQEIGATIVRLVLEKPRILRLYLQENRGPKSGARAPIVELADLISRYAVRITEIAHHSGILRKIYPPVSALAVVGACERLLLAVLSEEDVGNPLEIPEALITIILDGLRSR